MYRTLFRDAIRDIGAEEQHVANAVVRWMDRPTFDVCAEIAELDSGWLRELLKSVRRVPAPIRLIIANECASMFYAVGRIETADDRYSNPSEYQWNSLSTWFQPLD